MKFHSAAVLIALLAAPGFGQPGGGPQGGGPGGRRGPPPPAYDACAGQDENTPCSFVTPRGQESGTCVQMGDGSGEACLPAWAPRPPGRRRPAQAPAATEAESLPAIHPVEDSSPAPEAAPAAAEPAPAAVAAAAPVVAASPSPVTAAAPAATPAPAHVAAAAATPIAAVAPATPAPEPAPASNGFPWPIVLSVAAGMAALYGIQKIRSGSSTEPLPAPPTVPSPLTSSPTVVDHAAAPKPASAATAPLLAPVPPAPRSGHTLAPVGPNGGELIGGNYETKRKLGTGGMGVVFEAMDLKLDRRVALKKMRPEIAHNARARERFLAEAKTVAKLQHPNIVGIHQIIEEAGDLYLVFEYVDGSTLDDILHRQKRLTPQAAVKVLAGVAEAVDYAHEHRVIHRDLKPANIMLDREGRAKVMDFGIAHQAKVTVSQLTQVEAFGTMAYMPPEQELGQAVRESDVYAFAALMYEALTGGLPFPGPNFHLQKMSMAFQRPSAVEPPLPGTFDPVFERALQPEPKRRYPTTGEFVRTLSGAIAAA